MMRSTISLDDRPPSIELERPDDFGAFSVRVDGVDSHGRLRSELSRLGRVEGMDHVFVDVDAIKGCAGERAADPVWLESLDCMLRYAGSEGWRDINGSVRAHIEYSS